MLITSMRAQPVRIMISKAYMFEIQMVDEHSFAAICTSIIVLRDSIDAVTIVHKVPVKSTKGMCYMSSCSKAVCDTMSWQ